MSCDVADYNSWLDYEKFLKGLPRAERRRILHDHFNRAIKGNKHQSGSTAEKRSSALESSNKGRR